MDWFKEFIKTHVAEDKLDEVTKMFDESFPKHAVPKEKYNQATEKATNFESQFNESQKTIASMTDQVKGNDELKKSFDELKTTHDSEIGNYQTKLSNISKKSLAEKGLRGAKALEENIDLLMNDIKFDDMKVSEDGKTLVGFEDILTGIKTKRPSSFPTVDNDSNGGEPRNNEDDDSGFDMAKARKAMGLPPE